MTRRAAPPPPPPEVRCPACGAPAPRVACCVGLDIHACRCGALAEHWLCCGAVERDPGAYGYRGRDVCPGCGHDRRPAPAPPWAPLTGGAPNVLCAQLEQEVLDAAAERAWLEAEDDDEAA